MYEHLSYEKIEHLKKEGWISKSNFHFLWQSSNIIQTLGDKEFSLKKYIEIWRNELTRTHKCHYIRSDFETLTEWLSGLGVINESEVDYFNKYFSGSGYNSVNICPGIVHYFSYPKERLNEPEEKLADEVGRKIKGLLTVYAL